MQHPIRMRFPTLAPVALADLDNDRAHRRHLFDPTTDYVMLHRAARPAQVSPAKTGS